MTITSKAFRARQGVESRTAAMHKLPVSVSVLFFVVAFLTACGNKAPTSPTPVPSPAPTPQPVPTFTFSGTVTATNGGQRLSGVSVAFASESSVTDASGVFTLRFSGSQPLGSLAQLTGPAIIPRTTRFPSTAQTGIALEVFQSSGFDLEFYRDFARNGFESATLQPIRRFTQSPSIYLKTVDEGGRAIDAATLDTTASVLESTAGAWTGGLFGLARIERGTDTREGVSGWITVKWPSTPPATNLCGRATVGIEGGWIELNYLNPTCRCDESRMRPLSIRHELGHALGYWHTDSTTDLMWGGSLTRGCDQHPSAREREYARYVYSRPVGNIDPDIDPATVLSTPRAAGDVQVTVDY